MLIVVGALLLADAVVTLLWQEPLSALYGRVQQGKLDDRLAAIESAPLAAVDQRALQRLDAERRLAFAARSLARRSDDGDPLGRIRIPRIGVDEVFVQGTGTADLRQGPGHYPDTPLPGQRGTVAIAGHRTTYGAPFHDVDDLRRGDAIVLSHAVRTLHLPGRAHADRRADRHGGHRPRSATTGWCCPPAIRCTSAAQRIMVFARLERAEARGPAAAG